VNRNRMAPIIDVPAGNGRQIGSDRNRAAGIHARARRARERVGPSFSRVA